MYRNLFVAAKIGNTTVVEDIYRQIPSLLSKVTFERNTVLHIAAREGHEPLVSWILNNVKGCLSKKLNSDDSTPLHEAAEGGNDAVVKILLRHNKFAAWQRNQFGETPLTIASDHGHVDAVKRLLPATPLVMVFWFRDDGHTCLHAAAYKGHLEVVQAILRRPSWFNVLRYILLFGDEFGASPLHAAVHRGNAEIVREIIRTELDWRPGMEFWKRRLMRKKDKFGRCAVHVAAMKGDCNIIDVFLSEMPDCMEIRSANQMTALHYAVEFNQFHIVQKLLLENDSDDNAKLVGYDCDISGHTALHLAAMNAVDPQLLEYLVSLPKVNVNVIDNEGLTPLDRALSVNNAYITTILKDAGATQSLMVDFDPQLKKQQDAHESKILDVDTLVASLIATVTFAAIFSVPGGTEPDTGIATMSLRTIFHVFLFSDCLAFFASMSVVVVWIFRERLQTKFTASRSLLAKLSMLSVGISIVSTCLAFLTATILVTVPRHLDTVKDEHKRHEYKMIFLGEIVTAFAAPALAVVFLSLAWVIEYYFQATNERQQRLKRELKKVLVTVLPIATVVLFIIITYIIKRIL